MKHLILLFIFGWTPFLWSQNNVIELYQHSGQLYASEDFARFIPTTDSLITQVRSPGLLLRMAIVQHRMGEDKIALRYLKELSNIKACVEIDTFSVFEDLKQQKRFRRIRKTFQQNCVPIHNSQLAFQLSDPKLIPEGIASHPTSGHFYIGSLAKNKVVKYHQDTGEQNFTESGQDGLWSVLGMKVDPTGKELWLCSATGADPAHQDAGLFGFHLEHGTLIDKVLLPETTEPHLFNDLVFAERKILLTDSEAGKIYEWIRGAQTVTELATQTPLVYPNGIAIDSDQRFLFVADLLGIRQINLQTRTEKKIRSKVPAHLNGIDGLYFFDRSLIAVQIAGQGRTRIVRFHLNKKMDAVRKMEILQTAHPEFVLPTTGTIYDGHFYYIANSHLRNLQPDGTLLRTAELKGTKVFKIKIP
ncbi:MAG: hypothetical protein KTR30_08150 [Saprospiraceae bacterium]|nr:hypothetical protein [Saprospiraceae bacterium]